MWLLELVTEGWGFALLVTSLAIGGFLEAIITIVFKLDNDYNAPSWIVSLIVGCGLTWFIGKKLNSGWQPLTLNKRWGRKHTLLFILVQY